MKHEISILISLVAVFGVLCVTLSGIILWKSFNPEDTFNASKTDPLQVFKSYFKTPEEMDRLQQLINKNKNATITREPSICVFRCQTTGGIKRSVAEQQYSGYHRQRRSSTKYVTYHSCCSSEKLTVSPSSGINLQRITRLIVQDKAMKQYFIKEKCTQVVGCSGCKCSQPDPFIYEAVVYIDSGLTFDATKMEIDHIQMDGCCKCLNVK